jgi:hypothetical protein
MAMSAQRIAALAAALERDPALARRLDMLRQQACTRLDAIVRDTAARLAQQAPAPLPGGGGPMSVTALAAASRQRQAHARSNQELAEAFVLGALINQRNPDWNPLDPASSVTVQDSPLAALLTAGLPEPADTQSNR